MVLVVEVLSRAASEIPCFSMDRKNALDGGVSNITEEGK